MRFLTLAFASVFFFGGVYTAHAADFTNDSVIVDIISEDTSAEVVTEADSNVTPSSSGGAGEIINFGDGTNGEGGVGVIDEVEVTITSGTNNESGAQGGEGGDGLSSSGIETVSAQSILNTLTGNQALTSQGGSAGASGADPSASAGGSSGTNVSGSKTRQALLSRGITSLTIPPPPEAAASAPRKAYSRADLALFVSSEIVKNPDIDDVFFTVNSLSIQYRSTGRLLFALPIPYTTVVSLRFDEATAKKRVVIRFPWYKFLLLTGVSKSDLRTRIDAIITSAPKGEEYDRATQVFNDVAKLLGGGVRRIQ